MSELDAVSLQIQALAKDPLANRDLADIGVRMQRSLLSDARAMVRPEAQPGAFYEYVVSTWPDTFRSLAGLHLRMLRRYGLPTDPIRNAFPTTRLLELAVRRRTGWRSIWRPHHPAVQLHIAAVLRSGDQPTLMENYAKRRHGVEGVHPVLGALEGPLCPYPRGEDLALQVAAVFEENYVAMFRSRPHELGRNLPPVGQ